MEYPEIFAHRGRAYHRAMQSVPGARDAEFRELFRYRPARAGESVLDVPSGGGYLARVLPKGVDVTSLELSAGFSEDVRVVPTDGPWDVGRFDHAVCLAGLHHIADQNRFVSRLVAHARAGGIVHVADVDGAQPIAGYLDDFVGRYNSTGHCGTYLRAESFSALRGTRLLSSEIRSCPWRFENEEQLLGFCAALFALSGHSHNELRAQLEACAGITRTFHGFWQLGWKLRYIDLEVA